MSDETTPVAPPAPETLSPAWTFAGTYGALSAPLVVAGDRLIGVASSSVFAIDIYTGAASATGNPAQPQWLYTLQSFFGGDPQVTAAAGAVYLMDGDQLVALRLGDASSLTGWVAPTLPQVSSLFAVGGRVVVVNLDATSGATMVSGYDALTGARVFGPVQVATQSAGRIAYGDGALFFVASDALNAVNVDFGDVRWRFAASADALDPSVAPLVSDTLALVCGASLHAVDLTTGVEKWVVAPSSGTTAHWTTPVAGVAQTVVATNSEGDVVCVSLIDGHVVWRQDVSIPGAAVVIGDEVFVTVNGGALVARLDATTGDAIATYTLPSLSTAQPAAIANGALFLTDDNGNIVARPFASQAAAFFDGASSYVDVSADDAQFDFGTADFTVEAWFRSSTGGEIVSSRPTSAVPDAHGFRLNLTPTGQIRVAVMNAALDTKTTGRTNGTGAADGEWHHVAFVRRSGDFMIVLDGISTEVRLPDNAGGTALSIGGSAALAIGAFVPATGAAPAELFRGLIREVRIWDRALDITTIATNLTVELTGTEPRLKGLWRLDEVQVAGNTVEPRNEVQRHRSTASFVNAASRPTDLVMDRSAFPYLLHEGTPQWPYAGTWGARGEEGASGSAAVSSNGIVAFATSNEIYAVGAHDGKRTWSMDVSESTSDPVADGASFLVLSEEESLVRLDARTGAKAQVPAFAGMLHDAGVVLAPPAVSPRYIAAATGGGSVLVWDRTAPTGNTTTVSGAPSQLVFGDAGLGVLSHSGTTRTLSLIDPAASALLGQRDVDADAFCLVAGWLACVASGTVIKLDATQLSGAPLATSEPIAGTITGLLASTDEDLLVAVTDGGDVWGFTLGRLATRWRTTLPVGPIAGALAINPPVFDDAGRIACTTASGTIAFLDAGTGALVGLYELGRGAIGTPAVAAGTVYTGCTDTPANDETDDLDGALHSVVFGELMALRLNLDEHGAAITGGTQHAVVDVETAKATLHLMDVHQSCIEAWVNVPALSGAAASHAGGGILGICPTTASMFDVNLWLDPDGTLHYESRDDDGGTWSGVQVQAATAVVDGKWHHIAVSRSRPVASAPAGSPDRVIVYVDGAAVPTTVDAAPVAPATALVGLKAYIGATAADDLSASRPFCGMIGEVRVWDTYLQSTEISLRMHMKLRGDEPGLLAYWNFDREAVHDSALQGHDGTLAITPATEPVWWLADLPFTHPTYPYITNAAVLSSQEAGKPTSYALSVKVCAADGSGMAGQDVHVWYVKHTADDPATIVVNTTVLADVASDDEQDIDTAAPSPAVRFVGVTGSDGTLALTVTSALEGHGPALDLWTTFMPANERFHVNVLIDNQALAKPVPPSLTAQSKLIQDYHYTKGNAIDDTRDRSTWRVVLRAANADDTVRPREPIALWTSKATTIEVYGTTAQVNPDNSASFDAQSNGELVVVMSVDGLTAPTLYARAGFMHRNDRIVVTPDQDAHAQLSVIQGSDLTTPRVTNWKPSPQPSDSKPLVGADYAPHADDIAQAVRHVATSVKPADPTVAPAPTVQSPARLKLGATPSLASAAMRQRVVTPPPDRVMLMRTLAGTPRVAPVNPDALRASLAGSLGFVFQPGTGASPLTLLATQAEVDAARGQPTHGPMMVGGIFGDAWDDIKDAANDVYNGVTKIVVSIGDQIQLAITTMVNGLESVVHAVVATVEDALKAIAGFFAQLLVDIMMVIAFLRGLFDWLEIIRTHDILHDVFLASMDIAKDALTNSAPFISSISSIAGAPSQPIAEGGASINSTAAGAGGADSPVIAHANSVQSKSMVQRATSTPAQSSSASTSGVPDPTGAPPSDPAQVIAQALPGLAKSILDLSPSDLVKQLEAVALLAAESTLLLAADTVATLMAQLAQPIDWMLGIFDATIDIPFISALYKWITGRKLSILDLFCLALAIPVNVVYGVATAIAGNERTFSSDAGSLAADVRAAAGKPLAVSATASSRTMARYAPLAIGNAPVAVTVPGTPHAPEIALMVFRVITFVADVAGDALFGMQAAAGGNITPSQAELVGGVACIQGVGGMISLSLQTFASQPAFAARVRAVAADKADEFLPPYMDIVYAVYGIQMALRANRLRSGVTTMVTGTNTSAGLLGALTDKIQFAITIAASVCSLGVLIYQVEQLVVRKPQLAQFGNDDVTTEYEYFAIRDMLALTAVLFEWAFTAKGAALVEDLGPEAVLAVYGLLTLLRGGCNETGIILHGVAVFKHGG